MTKKNCANEIVLIEIQSRNVNYILHFCKRDLLVVAVEIDQSIISSDFLITNNCYLSPINKAINNAYRILNRSKKRENKDNDKRRARWRYEEEI